MNGAQLWHKRSIVNSKAGSGLLFYGNNSKLYETSGLISTKTYCQFDSKKKPHYFEAFGESFLGDGIAAGGGETLSLGVCVGGLICVLLVSV
jgi:hypothetical protein